MFRKRIGLAALPLLLAFSFCYANSSAPNQQQTTASSLVTAKADDTVQLLSSDLGRITPQDYETVNEQLTFNWNNNIP